MSILVTGGTGYIGSHTVVELINSGYDVIVTDNFSNSSPKVLERLKMITGKDINFVKCDLSNKSEVFSLFETHPEIDTVIHFAAYKAVGISTKQPLAFYQNNLASLIYVLSEIKNRKINNFVFSSSATVYGNSENVPFNEDSTIEKATTPYGWTKIMAEQILNDLFKVNPSMNIVMLRYFNPIGAHPSGFIGENPNGEPDNLMPYLAKTAIGVYPYIRIYGNDYDTPDGTGVRDYIHVVDIAKGHIAAVKKTKTNCGLVVYNMGLGKGTTVLEIIKAFENACGKEIKKEFHPRRDGDIAISYADITKAKKELNWEAKYTIEDMCKDLWNWVSKNPNGYND